MITDGTSRTDNGLLVERPSIGMVHVRLDRPEHRNALTTALLADLHATLVALGEDRDVRVVLLTGAGPTFCAGADLGEFSGPTAPDPADTLARVRLVGRVVRGLMELEVPTLVAVQGAAVGAGWGLAMACDLCWCTDDVQLSLPEVARGFRLPRSIMQRLIQIAGPIRAADIVLAGTKIDAATAQHVGLVNRRFDGAESLLDAATDFAVGLAARPLHSLRCATDPLRAAAVRGVAPEIEYQWPER